MAWWDHEELKSVENRSDSWWRTFGVIEQPNHPRAIEIQNEKRANRPNGLKSTPIVSNVPRANSTFTDTFSIGKIYKEPDENDILIPKKGSVFLEGVKFDEEKIRYDLIPPEFEKAVAEVLTFGAKKYGDRNWEKGFNWGRAYAALRRHLNAWNSGEKNDPETGLSHLHHAACNMAFLVTFEERNIGTDDRPVISRETKSSNPKDNTPG